MINGAEWKFLLLKLLGKQQVEAVSNARCGLIYQSVYRGEVIFTQSLRQRNTDTLHDLRKDDVMFLNFFCKHVFNVN